MKELKTKGLASATDRLNIGIEWLLFGSEISDFRSLIVPEQMTELLSSTDELIEREVDWGWQNS